MSGNVRDYGAVGDGLTDDTAAFQRALGAHKLVIVPTGVYPVSAMLGVPFDARLVGEAMRSTIIKRAPGFRNLPLVGVRGSLELLTIDGSWPDVDATFDIGLGEGGALDRVRWQHGSLGCAEVSSETAIINCELIGNGLPERGAFYGFWLGAEGIHDVRMEGTAFRDLRGNAVFGGADGLRISYCDFANNHCQVSPTGGGQVDIAGQGRNNDISHNRFRRCTGQASALEIDSVDRITIDHNLIEDQPGAGIVFQTANVHNAVVDANHIWNCGGYGVDCQEELDNLIWVNNRQHNNRGGNRIRARGLQDRNNAVT